MPRRVAIGGLPPLHDSQREVAGSPARYRIVKAGRRWGKTRLGVWECIKVALSGGRAWWVAPSYKLSKPGWRDLRAIARQVPGAVILLSDKTIEMPGGGEIQVRTAHDPDELRAESLDFVVLDEYALMAPEVWGEALRPALADRKGRAMFISTPKGMLNALYELWEQAATATGWSRHEYTTYDNPYMDPDEIDEMRRELGTRMFEQEVLGQFLAGVGTMFNAAWQRYFTTVTVIEEDPEDEDATVERVYYNAGQAAIPADECSVYITCDPAVSTKATADFTVFAVWAQHGDTYLLLEVVRDQLEAPDVLNRAVQLQQKHGALWVGFEATGFQQALGQFARRYTKLKVKKLRADADKVTRAWPLSAAMERGDVYFRQDAPWLDQLERELLMFPNAEHDDQVDALAYGIRKARRKWGAA